MKKSDMVPANAGYPIGVQDPKKTCNLETYLEWSSRLRLLVANEILLVSFFFVLHIFNEEKLMYRERDSSLLDLIV